MRCCTGVDIHRDNLALVSRQGGKRDTSAAPKVEHSLVRGQLGKIKSSVLASPEKSSDHRVLVTVARNGHLGPDPGVLQYPRTLQNQVYGYTDRPHVTF